MTETNTSSSAIAPAWDAPVAIQDLRDRLARMERRMALCDRRIAVALAGMRLAGAQAGSRAAGEPPRRGEPDPRKQAAYVALIARIRATVEQAIPSGATVMVVSKGDDELLKLGARKGWHFPQNSRGVYAGHHPADSQAATRHLEELRARGGQFLLFPATAFWWLEHYADFHRHLQARYPAIVQEEQTCRIFDVRGGRDPRQAQAAKVPRLQYARLVRQVQQIVDGLLPADAKVAVVSRGDPALLALGQRQAWHLPLDAAGQYAGHHPANGRAAVAQVQAAGARGAQFLLFPATAFWWLEYYAELERYLRRHGRVVVQQPHVCAIYEL